jgi:hypothetical protein
MNYPGLALVSQHETSSGTFKNTLQKAAGQKKRIKFTIILIKTIASH